MTLISYWSPVSLAWISPQKAHLFVVSGISDPQDLQLISFSNSMTGSILLFLRDTCQINARMMAASRIAKRIKLNMLETVQIRCLSYLAESY